MRAEPVEAPGTAATADSGVRGDTTSALRLVIALLFVTITAVSAARIVLSLLALQLGAGSSMVGLLVSTFFLFPVLLSWHLGRAADRAGSRQLLLLATVVGAIGMIGPVVAPGLPMLFAAAAATSFAFTAYAVLLQNLVGVLSAPAERTRNFSNAGVATAATMFTGPLIAGLVIDHAGYATACIVVTVMSLVATVMLVGWGDRLPKGSGVSAATPSSIRGIMRRGPVLRIIVASTVVQFGQDLFQFYVPIYGHAIGLSASTIGAVLASAAVGYIAVRFVLPGLVRRFGEDRLLRKTLVLAGIAFIAIALTTHPFLLGIAAFVFGLGIGCGQPLTMALLYEHADAGRSGETFGLRQTTNNVVRILAPSAFGMVAAAVGLQAVFVIAGVVVGTGAVLLKRRAPARVTRV